MEIFKEYKKKGQLRNTFIVLFIIISCVPILGLGTVSLINIEDSHKKNVSELEHQTLVSSSDVVTKFFFDITETLSTNFDTLDQPTLQISTTSWQEMYAKKFAEGNNALLEVSFVNLQGKEIAKYSKINNSKNYLYISELPLFKKAINGEISISNVHNTLKGQAITIAVPSILKGKVFNVVIAEVSLNPLISSLEKIKLGNSGYVILFDDTGELVGDNNGLHHNFSSIDRISRVLNGESFNAMLLEDRYESSISSLPVIGSAIRIPKLNWVMFVEWPITEANTIIENFRRTVLATIFISIFFVLITAYFFAYRLVKPIKLLQEVTKDIEQGKFDKQVSIKTNDELEELGESFNSMAIGLKQLEELKNEFVYVAAHELRAPVTAIKGYIELIFGGSGGQITPEMEHLLSPIQKSNDRLVNLVNDLLNVAKSEAGKLEIAISSSDIRKEISAILDEVKPLAIKKNITINYNPNDNLPMAMINTGSFKEVIMNFVSNAIKYGNDNGTITITHEVHDNMISTAISDNGRGISEEDQKHLFEKFFRAGEVKKTSIEGTGLGLFITKELVEKMGGTLSVKSELGKGTTFIATFKQAV